jgi:Peptidase_C39 like family
MTVDEYPENGGDALDGDDTEAVQPLGLDLPGEEPPDLWPDPDTMAGPGHALDPWWQQQSADGLCGPVSVASIVSEFTGSVHTEAEVTAAAVSIEELEELPDGAWSGMDAEGIERLLEHYGVPAHVDHGSLDELRTYLEQGRRIVLAVDSDEVWFGADDDSDPGDAGADHALVLEGIDDARGVAILNDPGNPDGQGYEIRLDTLDDACENGQMVVTDVVPGTIIGAPAEGAIPETEQGEPPAPTAPSPDLVTPAPTAAGADQASPTPAGQAPANASRDRGAGGDRFLPTAGAIAGAVVVPLTIRSAARAIVRRRRRRL